METEPDPPRGRPSPACLATVLAAAWMLRGWRARWIPHDEGTLAGSAMRILRGELPHRDFDEVYSGGLAYLHALSFGLFGERLSSLRLGLVAAAVLLFSPVLYALARRFAAPWPAAVVAVAAFAWGVPNYPGALPSWFNLMLAAAGFLALLSARGKAHPARYRTLAGVCIGLSISIKVAGLYALGGALVFLALEEQRGSQTTEHPRKAALLPLHGLAVLTLGWTLQRLMGPRAGAQEVLYFLAPPLAASSLLIFGERLAHGSSAQRLQHLLRVSAPLLLGTVLGVAPLVGHYASQGALSELYHGVFVAPAARLVHAAWSPPAVVGALWALPWVLLFGLAPRVAPRLASLALATACALLPFLGNLEIYTGIWTTLRPLPALLVLVGAWRVQRTAGSESAIGSALVVAVAFTGLIQFPYSTPLYFIYVAPLAVLLAAWLARPLGPYAAGFGLAFATLLPVFWLHTSTLSDFGWGYFRQRNLTLLDSTRGDLHVHKSEAALYTLVVDELQEHGEAGSLFAGPDAPELPFLTGREDYTRGPFAFFEGDAEQAYRQSLEAELPAAVVVNLRPSFSAPFSEAFVRILAERYDRWTTIGPFLVGTQRR